MPSVSEDEEKAIEVLLEKERSLYEIDNLIIQHCLNEPGTNVQQVARKLGVGKSTIYRRLHNEELDLPPAKQ